MRKGADYPELSPVALACSAALATVINYQFVGSCHHLLRSVTRLDSSLEGVSTNLCRNDKGPLTY